MNEKTFQDDEEYSLIPVSSGKITSGYISGLLNSIRPVWKGRRLIERVTAILPVDPSSACQRLFNAGIRDLKEKVLVVGLDLATEAAKNYKLPPIQREEDVLEYPTAKLIDLCYRMGILNRPEWRRLHRCYQIRRDLEHEDNEYEAALQDCFYIFKSTIDIVLSQDPVHLLKVTDVKQIIENATRVTLTEEFLENYPRAPNLRQKEISLFLISTAQNDVQPDIVRENAVEVLRGIKSITNTEVTIELARFLEEKLKGHSINLITAKVGHACGATAYFKKTRLKDYYSDLLNEFKKTGTDWGTQGKFMGKFEDIGGLTYCPMDLVPDFIKLLTVTYIGEPGGYGVFGKNRVVFYSDSAAPIISRIVKREGKRILECLEKLRKDKVISSSLENKYILRRYEDLIDSASDDED
jgi:hypothetical protein